MLLTVFICANAQTYRGTIRGTIYDPNRSAIPGAEIKLTNTETGETSTVRSGIRRRVRDLIAEAGAIPDRNCCAGVYEAGAPAQSCCQSRRCRFDIEMSIQGQDVCQIVERERTTS